MSSANFRSPSPILHSHIGHYFECRLVFNFQNARNTCFRLTRDISQAHLRSPHYYTTRLGELPERVALAEPMQIHQAGWSVWHRSGLQSGRKSATTTTTQHLQLSRSCSTLPTSWCLKRRLSARTSCASSSTASVTGLSYGPSGPTP